METFHETMQRNLALDDMLCQLSALNACTAARHWVASHGFSSPQVAWDACDRPDWLIWLIDRCKMEPITDGTYWEKRNEMDEAQDYYAMEEEDLTSERYSKAIRALYPNPPTEEQIRNVVIGWLK